jgi:hypothetical protein
MKFGTTIPARDLDAQLASDFVTPDQWIDLHRRHDLNAEQKLYFAILEDSIRSIQKGRKIDQEIAWIEGRDFSTITFERVCDVLGIDEDYLREKIVKRHRSGEAFELKRKSPVIACV